MKHDFSGYATKANTRCSDGRTIMPDAFKKNDGLKVPLVWQHGHSDPTNVLGHALLENRDDGVYAYGYLNATEKANTAKNLIKHGDIVAMSIYANDLVENSNRVIHGNIREVSLVLSGANPGALIDSVNIQHSDGSIEELDGDAIIYSGESLAHEENSESKTENKEGTKMEKTVQDVIDSMSQEQKDVLFFLVGSAAEGDDFEDDDVEHDDLDEEGSYMGNVFESNNQNSYKPVLSHSDIQNIMEDAKKLGSLRESVLMHAEDYGITNIEVLFPEAKALEKTPELINKRVEWVDKVLQSTSKSPFTRIKSISADITMDTARAKGYIKGNMKKEEFFSLSHRKTGPTTIYKKQKLDRDDIIDITDFDIVAWIRAEMRLKLDEEIARAILIGDGRDVEDEDKIPETNIRPIAKDHEFYTHRVEVAANLKGDPLIEAIAAERRHYKGSGTPTFYTTEDVLNGMLWQRDKMDRRIYMSESEVAAALRVKEIVVVDHIEEEKGLVGILVNLQDYTVGVNKGGAISMFEDFDIDFNQHKYLLETRMTGTLTKHKTAMAIWRKTGSSAASTDGPTDKVDWANHPEDTRHRNKKKTEPGSGHGSQGVSDTSSETSDS